MTYKGIDSRKIKCSDKSEGTIQAGISFDQDGDQHILNFHFLHKISFQKTNKTIIDQTTKSMYLDAHNTQQLIKHLKTIQKSIKKREFLIAVFEKMGRLQITKLEIGQYDKLADELLEYL